MDQETKQAFEQLSDALEAMQARIEAMESRTDSRLEAMEARILKRFEQTDERIFGVETKFLSAFRDWQQPINTRLRTLPSIDERLGLLEERLTALERKNLEREVGH